MIEVERRTPLPLTIPLEHIAPPSTTTTRGYLVGSQGSVPHSRASATSALRSLPHPLSSITLSLVQAGSGHSQKERTAIPPLLSGSRFGSLRDGN